MGIVKDVDDENVVPGEAVTVYHPFEQEEIWGGRLFVHASVDPYTLVTPITRVIRELSADQPVERAATLADVRAEVLSPDRLNALVFGGFAGVALAIAVVGVAGVLAFSVSARTREFGVRLAIGSEPRHLLAAVVREGALMAAAGIVTGALGGLRPRPRRRRLPPGGAAARRRAPPRLGRSAARGGDRGVVAARGARRARGRDARPAYRLSLRLSEASQPSERSSLGI